MSSYGRNFSPRLFIQAAFTGLLAPAGSRGSTWLMATFAVALGAAVVGAVVRTGHDRTRELVIGFEGVAVAVGGVGLAAGHYIPGTIVGIAALIAAVNHPMPRVVPIPAQPGPEAEPAEGDVAPQYAAPQVAAAEYAPPAQYAPAPLYAPAPEYAPASPQFAAPQYAAPAAPVDAPAAVAPEPTQPMPVVSVVPPQAPVTGVRAMTILPGK